MTGELVWRDGHDAAPQLRTAVAEAWTPERLPSLRLLRAVLARTGDGSLHVTARIRALVSRGEVWELVLEYPADEAVGVEAGAMPEQAAWWAMMLVVHVEEWWATRVIGVVRSATAIRGNH
jgi:hypothetical protein